MAKIKNYLPDNNITDKDIVIGSDGDASGVTKNFNVGTLKAHILEDVPDAPNLQQVTDEGNTTTNDIILGGTRKVKSTDGNEYFEVTPTAARIVAIGGDPGDEKLAIVEVKAPGEVAIDGDSSVFIRSEIVEISGKNPAFEGAQYNADYSSNFTDRSLVDKGYMDGELIHKADLVGGVVPESQLPSYVDDVIEVANFAALPVTGESGKIYITLDNNKTYRWGGSVYVELSSPQIPAALGLIKIVDKAGDFFTNLATASAYIRTFTSATITDESYSNGTFWFTVPNGSSFANLNGFLNKISVHTAYIEDTLGLINAFGNGTLSLSSGNSILGNVQFGTLCFNSASGINKIGNITLYNPLVAVFADGAKGRFEINGTIGTTVGNDYPNFFPNSTAVIWAPKSMQTNNAGGIEGDLAMAQTNGAKLFFGYAEQTYTSEFTDEFIYTSGAQNFTTLGDAYEISLVFLNGQKIVEYIQWTSVGNVVTVIDVLKSGDEISVNYKTAPSLPSLPYSKSQIDAKVLMSQTEWKNTNIGTQTIANGASLNLLTAVTNANKIVANTDTFDELNIVSNGIKTTWRGSRITHLVRLTFNIATGNERYYRMDLKRSSDNSVVASLVVQRNQAYSIQTVEIITRTLSATDPFVTGGFYLSLTNDSGASATLNGEMQLVIINQYQYLQ